MSPAGTGRTEVACGHLMFALAGLDVGIREVYHRSWTEVRLMVVLAVGWGLWTAALFVLRRRAADMSSARGRARAGFVLALGGFLLSLFGGLLPTAAAGRGVGMLGALAMAVLAARSASTARWDDLWRRLLLACTAGALLFLGSQPLVGYLSAGSRVWLPGSTLLAPQEPRAVMVILLMDELNASAAPLLADTLAGAGLRTQSQAVTPAGPHTAQAIPGMFVGHEVRDARACGPGTMCSMDGAIDFSKIRVTRPDVDFVGFFHPYCAIQGLRYCRRSVQSLPVADMKRWECLWLRQSRSMSKEDILECESIYIRSWVELKEDVLKSLWSAPVWTQGGLSTLICRCLIRQAGRRARGWPVTTRKICTRRPRCFGR